MADRFIDAFPYVDFFFMRDAGPTKWQRIPRAELGTHVAASAPNPTFSTVQFFASPEPVEADTPEIHYAFPYADFDSSDPAESQRDVLKLLQFCKDDLDLDDTEIRVWFSGGKGFHVLLSPTAFGVEPSTELTYIYKRMFGYLKAYLGLDTLDLSVYSKRRMWRVADTKHHSGLYKRELDDDQITDTMDAIKALASEPLGAESITDEADFFSRRCEQAANFYDTFRVEYGAEVEARAADPVRLRPDAAPGDPVCVTDVMTRGLRNKGDRNKATMILGTYYKDVGRDESTAVADISDWALGLGPDFRHRDDAHVKAGTESSIKAVYESDAYHFGCKFIRSLSGPKPTDGSKRDSIACMGHDCPFIKEEEPPTDSLPEIHLSRIGDPDLIDKPIRVKIRVAGQADAPYMVPSKVSVFSGSDDCERAGCALHGAGGSMTLDFTKDLRTLVALCNVPDAQHKTIIRDLIQKNSCKRFGIDLGSPVALHELAVMPKAVSIFAKEESIDGEYVYKHVYVLGNKHLKVNSYYEAIGRVYPHPKTQKGTMVITAVEPLQDVIEDFDLEEAKPLFKTYSAHAPEALMGQLIADIRNNIVKVGGRDAALMSVLMTLHSPIILKWQPGDEPPQGGWMQTLIIGDTGEAKSQMVERLMRHIDLGDIHSAQTSGRPGLLYTIVNKDSAHNFIQWGAFVLNDRGLLVIDEASGLAKQEYAELRNARRDGIFKVSRSVTGEAETRTRLLILSNPAYGKDMRHTQNGIEACLGLFEDADIRRFDLVVGFTAGQVKAEDIAALDEPVAHLFTPEVLRANILWAWSRKQEDILWMPGAAERVKLAADRLNKKYAGSNIHLLSMDAKEKIARMAQALAATLHSTDDLHVMLHVKPEHVDCVEGIVDSIYSSKDLGFSTYVRTHSEPADTDWSVLESQVGHDLEFLGVTYDDIMSVFMENSSVDSHLMESICADPKVAKSVTRKMTTHKLIRKAYRGGGYQPTARLGELIRRWSDKKDGV